MYRRHAVVVHKAWLPSKIRVMFGHRHRSLRSGPVLCLIVFSSSQGQSKAILRVADAQVLGG